MKNKLYIAIPTLPFKNENISDTYREIASLGARHIVLHVTKEMTPEALNASCKDFSALGLKLTQIKSEAMPVSYLDEKHFDEAVDEIKKLSEILKTYGGRQIELTAGAFRGKKEEHLEAACKFVQTACDIAQESGQFAALDFSPKKNQLIKTWEEMTEFYEKVDKPNLMLNVNTALLHHIDASQQQLEFLKDKAAMIEVLDIADDKWSVDINIGEGVSDIAKWIQLTQNYVMEKSTELNIHPTAVLEFRSDDKKEISRTFKYMERILKNVVL